MSRRTAAWALLVIAVLAAAGRSEAQSVFPTVFAPDEPTAPAPLVGVGVGANGEKVDPYVLTHEVNSGGCLVAFVPLAVVTERCADDDGCVLRLVSDTNGSGRVAASPRSFVTAANGLSWTVSTGFSTYASGLNGNMTVTEILEVASNSCTIWDDFQNTSTDYELRVCNNVSCTFRIDD